MLFSILKRAVRMVLGLVSGSMPMLVSLLLMQGITLTMWRSFLDRAIPKLEPGSDRLRKSLENLFIAQQANMVTTTTTTPSPTLPPTSLSSSLQSSPEDDYNSPNSLITSPKMSLPNDPASLTRTLELLSKIDPNVLKLFAQLTSQQSSGLPQSSPPTVSNQQPSVSAPLSADQPSMQYLHHSSHHHQHDSLYSGYQLTNHDHDHHPHHHYPYTTSPEDLSNTHLESPYETPGHQLQYIHYPTSSHTSQDDPNVKYIEVSSGNINYDQEQTVPTDGNHHEQSYDQQIQYVYQPQSPGDTQYEYVQQEPQSEPQSSQEVVEQEPETIEPQQQELEEVSSEEHNDQSNTNQAESVKNNQEQVRPSKEEDVAEDSVRPTKVLKPKTKDKRPPVIIGAPIIKSHRYKSQNYLKLNRKRKLKRLQRERYLKYLRLHAHKSRMFGKPQQRRKRMLFFKDFYSKKKKEQEVEQRTSTFSFKRKRKRKKPKKEQHQSSSLITTAHHPGFGGPYRFATPASYPLIMFANATFPAAKSSFPQSSLFHHRAFPSALDHHHQNDLHVAENQMHNFRTNETVRRTTIDMNKVNKSTSVKLKSKKIKLFDLHSLSTDNCTIPESNKTGRMKTLWTSKNGQINTTSKCIEPIKFTSGNNIKLNLAPKNVMSNKKALTPVSNSNTLTLKNEILPEILSTTTPIIENNTNVETSIKQSVLPEIAITTTTTTTTTMRPETTTSPSTTIDPMSKFDANTFFLGLNNFLKNYATSTPRAITTTTTSQSDTDNLVNDNFGEQLPKEFMLHILKAINMSKIDNFQVNTRPEMRNQLKIETEDESDGDNNTDEEEDEEEEDINLPVKDVENVVDGVMPVGHRFKRVCYYLLDGGKDGQLDIGLLELHICSHLIVGYARVSTTGLVIVEKPLEDTEK